MATQFEAVGGVLLAVDEGVPPDRLSAVENGLLLAWLATAKTPTIALADTLAKIGWTSKASDAGEVTLAASDIGGRMLDLSFSQADVEAARVRLGASAPDPVVQAWWGDVSTTGVFAFATISADGTLHLASFTITRPEERLRIFAPQDDPILSRAIVTSTLNLAVYATVADAIADKIAAHRGQIVRLDQPQ